MIMPAIKFMINSGRYIEMEISGPEQGLFMCDEVKIILYDNGHEYVLYDDIEIRYAIEKLNTLLTKALHNKLQLHESIQQDIGYLWNELLQDRLKLLARVNQEGGNRWIGTCYLLWEIKGLDTWLYNKDEKIFMELAPVYKWHFDDPETGEDYITYDEFIKDYKPYLIVEIDKKVAQQWLAKTEELMQIIQDNYEKSLKEEDDGLHH